MTLYVFVHDDHIDINYTCICDHICDKAYKVVVGKLSYIGLQTQ